MYAACDTCIDNNKTFLCCFENFCNITCAIFFMADTGSVSEY